MNDQSFSAVVAGLEVDQAAAEREIAATPPADRDYIVFFTPRSGSSWLTSVLAGTGLLGTPDEFVNPAFLRDVAAATNTRDPASLMAVLRRRRKSLNGVFGMETLATHVALFGEDDFFAAFGPGVVTFFLWRDNLIAQGVSLYRAVATERFHSSSAPAGPPEYDSAQIRQWVTHVCHNENANLEMLVRRGLFPRMLRYEDIVRDRATTIAIFADAMRVDIPAEHLARPKSNELRKIGDNWNRDAELRFRAEQPTFVATIEARRAIKADP